MYNMKQTESLLVEIFGDSSRIKIVDYLMEFPTNAFTPSELVEGIGMSRTTVFRELNILLNQDMIKSVDKIGKSLTFTINLKSLIVRLMQQSVHFRSEDIADRQLARKNIRTIIRTNLKNREVLYARKKMLQNELRLTKQMIETMPVR